MPKNADNQETVIEVKNLHKRFLLPHQKSSTIKNYIAHPFQTRKQNKDENQVALKTISFDVKKGEFFGIVGRNGSGKSTLLKCLAGVYTPDGGSIRIDGTIVPFIELGVGFNHELSGRDNVFLNGALLGFSRQEMEGMYDEIVKFSELERFMDQRLKNYSSGMQVRLAFSIAIQARGDILLLDEVLAVGDTAFQQKCFDYFATLKRNKQTIILVTHSMSSVERFCDRAMLIENGEVQKIGKSSKVAALYEDLFIEDRNKKEVTKDKKGSEEKAPSDPADRNISVGLMVKQHGKSSKAVKAFEPFTLDVSVTSRRDIKDLNLGVNIRNEQDKIVFSTDLRSAMGNLSIKKGVKKTARIEIDNRYTNGRYTVDLHVVDESVGSNKILLRKREIKEFHIMGITQHAHSWFHPEYTVKEVE